MTYYNLHFTLTSHHVTSPTPVSQAQRETQNTRLHIPLYIQSIISSTPCRGYIAYCISHLA